jgi:hypothetical protein
MKGSEIRAGLGRNEWTFLIAYPDRAEHFVTQINGSRDDALAGRAQAGRYVAKEAASQGALKLFSRGEMNGIRGQS